MNDNSNSSEDPTLPSCSPPNTLLASLCSMLLLLRRRHALPSTLLSSSSSSSSSSHTLLTILDRSLGAAVTLGLSLVILKWVASIQEAANSTTDNKRKKQKKKKNSTKRSITDGIKGNNGDTETASHQTNSGLGFPPWLEELIRWILPFGYYFPRDSTDNDDDDEVEDEDETIDKEGDGEVVIHRGSCHCRSILFQWEAPRNFELRDGPGKIRYRHTQIPASSFQLLAGSDCLQTYYVVATSSATREEHVSHAHRATSEPIMTSPKVSWDHHLNQAMHNNTRDDNRKVGAHSFCRRCGVHILYAPSSHLSKLEINVDCSEEDQFVRGVRPRSNCNKIAALESLLDNHSISEGFALPGQWQPQPQYPLRPPESELKGMLEIHHHHLTKLQKGELGPAVPASVSSVHSEPTVLLKNNDPIPCRKASQLEAKPNPKKLLSPDTPSTIATSCDGLSLPATVPQGESVGGDASSSFAEDMLSSTSSSSSASASDGDESTNNDLVKQLVWTDDEQDCTLTSNPSPLSYHSNRSSASVGNSSLSALPSLAKSTIPTPMLRDQLKYYMSKHVGKPKKG